MVVKPSSSTALLLVLSGLGLPNRDLCAQARPAVPDLRNSAHIGAGYVANVPNTYVGFNLLGIAPRLLGGAGIYADVKLTAGSPGNDPYFIEGVTVEQAETTFGDRLFEEKSDWLSVNLALAYAVTPELALYGGAGYSRERRYRQYFDNSATRGNFGFYWISDSEGSGDRVNLLGGGFIRLARFALLQIGGETEPRGVTLGLTFTYSL